MPKKTKNKILNKKYKIIASIGAVIVTAGTSGGLTYAFVWSKKPKIIKIGDIFSETEFAHKFFSFVGEDGKGTVKYVGSNYGGILNVKYLKVNTIKTKTSDLKESDFILKSKDLINLKNNDIIYAKFFTKNSSAFKLDNKLSTIFQLKVKGLTPPPFPEIDLKGELEQFKDLYSRFTSSQLYKKFSHKKNGDLLSAEELGIINENSFKRSQKVNVKHFFEGFSRVENGERLLNLKIELSKTNPSDPFKLIHNDINVPIKASRNYSYVQKEIDKSPITFAQIDKNDPKYNPDNWKNITGDFPAEFDIQEFYKYNLPNSIGNDISISKYIDLSLDKSPKKSIKQLTVTAEIKDLSLDSNEKIENNKIKIRINLFEEDKTPDTLDKAKIFFESFAPKTRPYKMNLNYSKLKSLFNSYRKGYELKNIINVPLGSNLETNFLIDNWEDESKLLKLKVKIIDTLTLNKEETYIYLSGSEDLSSEIAKIDDFFLQNTHFFTPKSSTQLNKDFEKMNIKEEITSDYLQEILPNSKTFFKLTDGIKIKYEYIEWNEKWSTLEFKVILKDENSPNQNNPKNLNNEITRKIKLIPKYDFTKDKEKFTSIKSRFSYAKLHSLFNEDNGTAVSRKREIVTSQTLGFITPHFSKDSIEVRYKWMGYDSNNKEVKIRAILIDNDSKSSIYDSDNFKDFEVKGSNDLNQELEKVNGIYTVFSQKDSSELDNSYQNHKEDDFTQEIKELVHKYPKLTDDIILSYSFKKYENSNDGIKIKLEAKLTDSCAPMGAKLINNVKEVVINIIPAYNFQSIVDVFDKNIPKEIRSLNNSELYNLFYDENNNPKQKIGSIIDPEIIKYTDKILLPSNFKTIYKFDGWNYDDNVLKVKVILENTNLPSQLFEKSNEFEMNFFGTGNLQKELDKIEYIKDEFIDLKTMVKPYEIESYLQTIRDKNRVKMSYKETADFFDKFTNSSFRNGLSQKFKEIGFENLTPGIKAFFTITQVDNFDKNKNPFIHLKLELKDTRAEKNILFENNQIDDIKIKFLPYYDIGFIEDFLNPFPNTARIKTFLNPKGVIDLSKIDRIKNYETIKKMHKWDQNPRRRYEMPDFFAKFVGNYGYGKFGSKSDTWSLQTLFNQYKIIDPNTNKPFNENDYYIRVSVQGYDDINKFINVKFHVRLLDAARLNKGWPPSFTGYTKEDLFLVCHFKFR